MTICVEVYKYLRCLQEYRLIPPRRTEKPHFAMKPFPALPASTGRPLHRSQYIEKVVRLVMGGECIRNKNNGSTIHHKETRAVIYHKFIVLALGRSVYFTPDLLL